MEAVYTTDDATRWNSLLPAQESVFGSVEFARIVQGHLGYQARLFVLRDHSCSIVYPFFCRPIHSWLLHGHQDALSDTVSPEYTGPLVLGKPVKSFALDFLRRFSGFAFSHRLIAEFIHLHPWKAFTGALLEDCLEFNREIVYVDLTLTERQLWQRSFNRACRQNIERSQRHGVRVLEARTIGDVREFHRIYTETMSRRNALKRYHFSLDYFASIFERLRENSRFLLAEYRNQVVAGMLCLFDRDDAYAYLGGADAGFQDIRPTNAVIYDMILRSKRQGRKRLILGGGYSHYDGVFRFKASFSPVRAKFFVYKRVHQPVQYAALCRAWSRIFERSSQAVGYFPPYRFMPDPEADHNLSDAVPAAAEEAFGVR